VPGIYEALNDFVFAAGGKILAAGKVQPPGAPSNKPERLDTRSVQCERHARHHLRVRRDHHLRLRRRRPGPGDRPDGGRHVRSRRVRGRNISASSRKPVLAQFSPDGRQILSSLCLPRNDSLGQGLVYQNGLLRVAGSSSLLTGGFVDDITPDPGGLLTATGDPECAGQRPGRAPGRLRRGRRRDLDRLGFRGAGQTTTARTAT